MAEYAILRISKIRTLGKLNSTVRHNERVKPPLNAAGQEAQMNRQLAGNPAVSISDRWKTRLAGAGIDPEKIRSNAVLAIELFCGFSPEARERISFDSFADAVLQWVENRFGRENILSAVAHLDEKTPHVQFILIPVVRKMVRGEERNRLAAREWVGSPAKLIAMQDEFARAVESFGLQRGERGSKRKHVPQKDLYRDANLIEASQEEAAVKITEAAKDGAGEGLKGKVAEAMAPIVAAAKKGTLQLAAETAQIETGRKLDQERTKRIKAEDEAKAARRELADRLRELPVSEIFEKAMGVVPRKEGQSLVFETETHKWVVTGQKFAEFKAGEKGGGGAIDTVKAVLKCDFNTALRWLETEFPGQALSCARSHSENQLLQAVSEAKQRPFSLEEKMEKWASQDEGKWSQGRAYLVETRALPGELVDLHHQKGDLWTNEKGSVVFAHRNDEGEIRGATIRATRGDFKQCIGDKTTAHFAVGAEWPQARRVAITESPIEAMSLAAHEKNDQTRYVSTAGTGGVDPIVRKAASTRATVLAAQNADEPGERQAKATEEACKQAGVRWLRLKPPIGKDWNDLLKILARKAKKAMRLAVAPFQSMVAGQSEKPMEPSEGIKI